MRKQLVLTLAVFVSISIASDLHAEIVFSNFGPGDSFSTSSQLGIGGSPFYEQGSFFQVSGADYTVDSIEAAVRFLSGKKIMTMTLYSTSGGLPTTALESVTIKGLGSTASIESFTFGGTTVLQDGETYALVASATGSSSFLAWHLNDIGDTGNVYRVDGGSWSSNSGAAAAFRVNGTVVPEPSAIVMFGAAMIGLSFSTRRRRVA